MTDAEAEFRRRMQALAAAFAAELPQRVDALESALQAWTAAPGEAPRRAALLDLVHRLKGAGSTFGYPEVSAAARRLEQRILAAAGPGSAAGFEAGLEDLRRAVAGRAP